MLKAFENLYFYSLLKPLAGFYVPSRSIFLLAGLCFLSTKVMSKKKFGPKFFWLEKKNLGKKKCLPKNLVLKRILGSKVTKYLVPCIL